MVDITDADLSKMGRDVYVAYNEWKESNKDGTIEQFFNTAGKEYYEKYKETLANIDKEIVASKEINFDTAANDADLKDAMGNLTSFSFIDEDGNKDEEVSKLFYELAQNETYADCMDEKSADGYKNHLKDNLEKINEELILNQLIFENYKDVDFAGLSDEKREEYKKALSKKYEEAKTKFGQGKFLIAPEVATATLTVHSHNLQPRAQHYEKFGIKTLWNRIKQFDDKAAKKFPKLYPLAKNMLINGAAGMVAGPLGLAVVAAGKTAIEIHKIHKQAKAHGKSLGEYLKENKDVALRLGFQVAGAAVTAVIGVQAVSAGSIGMIHHGSFKAAFGTRLARAVSAVGAGAASSAGQFKKGNLKQGFKALGLTTLAAGAGLILGEHGSEWVHKIFGGNQPEVDTVSGADANQIDQTTPTAQQQTLNNNIDPSRPAVAPELQGASTAAQRFEMANDPTTEYGGTHSQPQAPMEETPTTSLDDNTDETPTRWVRDENPVDRTAAGEQAREMAQDMERGQYSAENPAQEINDKIPTEPSTSPVAEPQQTGTEINTDSTVHSHSNVEGNAAADASPVAQEQPTVDNELSDVTEQQPVNPRESFDFTYNDGDLAENFDGRQDFEAIKNGSTYARTDGVPPLSETAATPGDAPTTNLEDSIDSMETRVDPNSFAAAGQSGMREGLDYVSGEQADAVNSGSAPQVSGESNEMTSGEKVWNDLMNQNTGAELSTNPSDTQALLDSAVVGKDGIYQDLESTLPPNWHMGEAQDLPSGGSATPIYNDEGKLVGFMQDECLPSVNNNDVHRLTLVANGERIVTDVDMTNNEVISQTHIDNENHTLHNDNFVRDEHGLGKVEPNVEFNGNNEQAAGLTSGLQENMSSNGGPLKLPDGYHLGEDVTHGANQTGRAILDANGHTVGYLQEQTQGEATLRTITTQDGSSFQEKIEGGHVTEQTTRHTDGTSSRTIFNYDADTNEITSSEQFNYKDGQLVSRVETCTASAEADGFDGKVISSRDGQGNLLWEDKTGVDERGNYYHSYESEHASSRDYVDDNGLHHIENASGNTKSVDVFDSKSHLPLSHSETVDGHTTETQFRNDGKHVTGYSTTVDGKVTETGKMDYYSNGNLREAVIRGTDGSSTEFRSSEDGLSTDTKIIGKDGKVTLQHTDAVKVGDRTVVSHLTQELPDGSKLDVHNIIDEKTGKLTGIEMTSTKPGADPHTYKVAIKDDGSATYSHIANGKEIESGHPLDPKVVHHYHKEIDQRALAERQVRLDEFKDHKLAHDEHRMGKPSATPTDNVTDTKAPEEGKPNLWQRTPTWVKVAGGALLATPAAVAVLRSIKKKSADSINNASNGAPKNTPTPSSSAPQNTSDIIQIGAQNESR